MKKNKSVLFFGLTALFTALLVIFTLGCPSPTGDGGGGETPLPPTYEVSGFITGDDNPGDMSGASVQLIDSGNSPVGDPTALGASTPSLT
jgi:hypothetical protein